MTPSKNLNHTNKG